MSLTINVNELTLCHKGSKGVSRNTLPDVCKTPGTGIPIPYPNVAYSSDLTKGTTSVFADGGNMIANLGSRFARSVFDEAGTMGGIVSGTNRAEADWISHSFDVFFEKKPACRLTDKMFMNHRNTVNMSGLNQEILGKDLWDDICEAICECKDVLLPSVTEVKHKLEELIQTLGIDRSEFLRDQEYLLNDYNNRQDCFAEKFNEKPYKPYWANDALDPSRLTEVPYEIGPPGKLIESETGRKTKAGATAPGSKVRALSKARELGRGEVVIWDMVILEDPAKPAELDNVKHIVEIKFKGDKLTKNQEKALEISEVYEKNVIINESECTCESDEDREELESKIKEFIITLLLAILFKGKKLPRAGSSRGRKPEHQPAY